ncbi:haloacid dehalogenase type II [Pollutibacter soli]|uniref:haloacid dehalogenase type II n=1 Tax=Pollutibacter soli TaxID=3034157 RepID=UPI003013FAC1
MTETLTRPELIICDVYDTILDMSDLRKRINHILGSRNGYATWFDEFTQYFKEHTADAQPGTFEKIFCDTLANTAAYFEKNINEIELVGALELLKHLPLKEDVQQGLSELADLGFRIGTLTNASQNIINVRMKRTGLISYFEKILSAETYGMYKPETEVYHWAAAQFGVVPEAVLFLSSHLWDIRGASTAGMQTAYLQIQKETYLVPFREPDFTIHQLQELVALLDHKTSHV